MTAYRRNNAAHPIEQIGEKLRAMMPDRSQQDRRQEQELSGSGDRRRKRGPGRVFFRSCLAIWYKAWAGGVVFPSQKCCRHIRTPSVPKGNCP